MIEDQPPPQQSKGDIWELVIADMNQRRRVGLERYGTPLQAHNGRASLVDAYQESLDQAVYLRQFIEEQNLELTKPTVELHDPMIFPEVYPLLHSIERLQSQAKKLSETLGVEKFLRLKFERIVLKMCRLLNKRLIGSMISEHVNVENVEQQLDVFEVAIHAMLLGINPKGTK